MINGNTKYGVWLKEWLNVYKVPFIKERSVVNIEICIRKHIPDHIKETPLRKLTPFDIQKAVNNVELSRTRLSTYDVYHDSLNMAYKLGFINKNPCIAVIRPKHKRIQGEPLDHEELKQFFYDLQSSRCKNVFLFYIYTGCRRSEALTVQWSDIDYTGNVIHIKGTKTDGSDRIVPLFPDLKLLLQNIRHSKKDNYVFHFTADYVTREFKRICAKHKLHDLRHTYATTCLESDISLKVIQKWLGHSRLNTTANIYAHALDRFTMTEADKFKLPL